MNRFTSLTIAALLTFCAGSAFAQGPTPAISADSAQAIALKEVPGGTVQSQDLENESGVQFYSFDITVSGQTGVEEVHVDANSGAVISHEHSDAGAAAPSPADSTPSLPDMGAGSDDGAGAPTPGMPAPGAPMTPGAPTPNDAGAGSPQAAPQPGAPAPEDGSGMNF